MKLNKDLINKITLKEGEFTHYNIITHPTNFRCALSYETNSYIFSITIREYSRLYDNIIEKYVDTNQIRIEIQTNFFGHKIGEGNEMNQLSIHLD
jgi:hypothetical protein